MKTKRYLIITLAILIFNLTKATAQENLVLYNLDAPAQRMYYNPALLPTARINIGLPILSSLYFNMYNSSFKYTDLVQKGTDDSLHLNLNNLYNKLSNNNYIASSLHFDLFSFGIKIKKNYFSFNATEKTNTRFRYPKDLLELALKGNGALLDKNIMLNFGLNITHYREYSLGYTREVNEKWTIGGKIKYLYGMENIAVEKSDITLTTSSNSNFPITIKSNILINSSGIDSNSFNNFSFSNYAFNKKNNGIAADIGINYKATDKLSFSASLLDVGAIQWTTAVNNFKSTKPEAAFIYNGINLNLFIQDSSNTQKQLTQLKDSIINTLNIDSTHNKYTTTLPAQIYIGANYHINPKNNAGILFYGQIFNQQLYPALSLSYNTHLGKWLAASASYSILKGSYNNIGLGIALNLSALQLYIANDNLLDALMPYNAKNIHLHFGFNLIFGRTAIK